MKKKKVENELNFPIITNVSSKLLANNIISFNPSDPEDDKRWKNEMNKIFDPLKKEFEDKGIPFPKVIINTEKRPIDKKDHPLLR